MGLYKVFLALSLVLHLDCENEKKALWLWLLTPDLPYNQQEFYSLSAAIILTFKIGQTV